MKDNTVKSRYDKFSKSRNPFVKMGERASKLTIPSLFPENGHTGESELYTPFQSVGAKGLNNLTSKTLLTLLPPNEPFFEYEVDDYTLKELEADGQRAEVSEVLDSIRRTIQTEMETSYVRIALSEALKHYFAIGNVLLYLPKDNDQLRVFPLNKYVVKRDPSGNVLEIITLESVSALTLSENAKQALERDPTTEISDDKNIDI